MRLQDVYPLITTDKLDETREFYRRLGFEVGFESEWFVWLYSGSQRPFSLAFMKSNHPSSPPGPETFSGKGMILTFQVADSKAEYERLKRAGLPMYYELHDEPWGQRRFMLQDPSGVLVDVVQQL